MATTSSRRCEPFDRRFPSLFEGRAAYRSREGGRYFFLPFFAIFLAAFLAVFFAVFLAVFLADFFALFFAAMLFSPFGAFVGFLVRFADLLDAKPCLASA